MSRTKVFSRVGAVVAAAAIGVGLMVGGCDNGDDNPGNGGGGGNPNINYGSFTDTRDGQKYRTVKIGSQTWMAENLNFVVDSSWCYDENASNCMEYGRLYTWNAAMSVCPSGWHVPSRDEWKELLDYAGGSSTSGKKLKSESGWNDYRGASGNGTDKLGFSAMPGGNRYTDGRFLNVGGLGAWWSATESGSRANGRYMGYSSGSVNEGTDDKGYGYSVRCVQ